MFIRVEPADFFMYRVILILTWSAPTRKTKTFAIT